MVVPPLPEPTPPAHHSFPAALRLGICLNPPHLSLQSRKRSEDFSPISITPVFREKTPCLLFIWGAISLPSTSSSRACSKGSTLITGKPCGATAPAAMPPAPCRHSNPCPQNWNNCSTYQSPVARMIH